VAVLNDTCGNLIQIIEMLENLPNDHFG